MTELHLTYLSVIGTVYLLLALTGMITFCNRKPGIKLDQHSINEGLIGACYIIVDVVMQLSIH